jgi:hypothetical protein
MIYYAIIYVMIAVFDCIFIPFILPSLEPKGSGGFALHLCAWWGALSCVLILVGTAVYQIGWSKLKAGFKTIALSMDALLALLSAYHVILLFSY